VQKSILDLVALAVKGLVMAARLLAILAWRDLRLHTLAPGLSNDGVTVIAFIGNQMPGINMPQSNLPHQSNPPAYRP
jgi:hypothetical protein